MRCIAIVSMLLLAGICHAQPTSGRAGLEPGQAENQVRHSAGPIITEFTSPSVEARGIWLASRDMTAPAEQLLARLDAVKAANFNTILIDTYFRGYVAYPGSEYLPQFPDFAGRDVLTMLIDECRARGLHTQLWMEYGFYSYFTADATKDPSMGPLLDRHPELLSIDSHGNRFIHRSFGDFYSICPSNPKSHEILAGIFAEAINRYPADGVNLDRIRYADANYCFCDYCRRSFRADAGIELREFAEGCDEARAWLQWKRRQTLRAVETIARAIRAARPGAIITSYVVGPGEMDSKAQAWDLWMQHKLLDAVAVSMYGAEIRPAAERAIELLGGDRSRLIAAISCDQTTAIYLSNVELSRRLGMIGQFTWHWGDVGDDLDGLGAGPYRAASSAPAPAEAR